MYYLLTSRAGTADLTTERNGASVPYFIPRNACSCGEQYDGSRYLVSKGLQKLKPMESFFADKAENI